MSDMRNDDPNFDVMGNFDHGLTLALSKGRILKETLPLLETAGINLLEDPDKSRKLIFPTTHKQVRILILRASDVPTYVENGAADIGVAGKDVLMEHGAQNVYEPLDLKIAVCKLMTAGKVGMVQRQGDIHYIVFTEVEYVPVGSISQRPAAMRENNGFR